MKDEILEEMHFSASIIAYYMTIRYEAMVIPIKKKSLNGAFLITEMMENSYGDSLSGYLEVDNISMNVLARRV